ncbi:hypothetical protein IFM89_025892 [Coptis chinensis]|uniref:DUF4283 domain-containing protein n=1 Tax=Coptis chinensis TaxID=261450 RepID=A0A835LX84_9MAGN|nr:hypothetical protein IFM89_025892 [Coptis chinensis]
MVKLWIQIFGLPENRINEENIKSIGLSLGKVKAIDLNCSSEFKKPGVGHLTPAKDVEMTVGSSDVSDRSYKNVGGQFLVDPGLLESFGVDLLGLNKTREGTSPMRLARPEIEVHGQGLLVIWEDKMGSTDMDLEQDNRVEVENSSTDSGESVVLDLMDHVLPLEEEDPYEQVVPLAVKNPYELALVPVVEQNQTDLVGYEADFEGMMGQPEPLALDSSSVVSCLHFQDLQGTIGTSATGKQGNLDEVEEVENDVLEGVSGNSGGILSDGMADPASYVNAERDIDQDTDVSCLMHGLIGPSHCLSLLTIGRSSQDEKTLIWLSHGEERNLKLSLVSKIVPGQRTAVFRRFPRPEKDYLSFSLLYGNGERSLDPLNGGDFIQNSSRPFSATLEATSSFLRIAHSKSSDFSSREPPSNTTSSDVGSDRANMQLGLQPSGVENASTNSSSSVAPPEVETSPSE